MSDDPKPWQRAVSDMQAEPPTPEPVTFTELPVRRRPNGPPSEVIAEILREDLGVEMAVRSAALDASLRWLTLAYRDRPEHIGMADVFACAEEFREYLEGSRDEDTSPDD